MHSRKPYHGASRKLVLAFDVGTTYSGISYSILDPGNVPEIMGVNSYPAQTQTGGDSKIPTVIYYDQDGVVSAVGAEALLPNIIEQAEDENWVKVEWFKLHLRPESMSSTYDNDHIPPLPRNKTIVDVFADFLQYLYTCARKYIQDAHASGKILWESLESHIEFVLTHPNGWEGAQQNQMRRAVVLAGLVPDNEVGRAQIQFVTEGEASLHFCIQSGLTTEAMKAGNGVLIVDAGGGTIDLSAYVMTSSSFEEIAPPQCHFKGSIFVTRNARLYLEDKLRNSRFIEDINHITDCFDKSTKLSFRNSAEPSYIKFGTARDRDASLNIRGGQLKLPGTDVAAFFEPSIRSITEAIVEQCSSAHRPISTIFLVGGFGASDWLFSTLQNYLQPLGLDFSRPDSHLNKAVADGAISFYLDHFVSVRVSRFTYGTECSWEFDEKNPDHQRRSSLSFAYPSGWRGVRNGFRIILPKGTQVSENKEFRASFWLERPKKALTNKLSAKIVSYRGQSEEPKWIDTEPDMFSPLCIVEADTSGVPKIPEQGSSGKTFYTQRYSVILSFGLTELKAQLCWTEQGEEKRSPARIIYD